MNQLTVCHLKAVLSVLFCCKYVFLILALNIHDSFVALECLYPQSDVSTRLEVEREIESVIEMGHLLFVAIKHECWSTA